MNRTTSRETFRKLALALAPGLIPLVLLLAASRRAPDLSLSAVFDRPTPQHPAVVRESFVEWQRLMAQR